LPTAARVKPKNASAYIAAHCSVAVGSNPARGGSIDGRHLGIRGGKVAAE
jgi:hypothetical protein